MLRDHHVRVSEQGSVRGHNYPIVSRTDRRHYRGWLHMATCTGPTMVRVLLEPPLVLLHTILLHTNQWERRLGGQS
ncbi:accessory protein [Paris virus 2]|nr:accessory protein [Paris virus 2]